MTSGLVVEKMTYSSLDHRLALGNRQHIFLALQPVSLLGLVFLCGSGLAGSYFSTFHLSGRKILEFLVWETYKKGKVGNND